MWRGGCHTLCHLHVVHANHGDEEKMNCDQLSPLPGAPNVVVLQTTAGWRKAPALAQRVYTQGVASLRSVSLKNTRNTAGFRVVRAAGA
jgi:hypothetical protein